MSNVVTHDTILRFQANIFFMLGSNMSVGFVMHMKLHISHK